MQVLSPIVKRVFQQPVDFGTPLNTGVIKNFRLILTRTMVGMLGGAEFCEHMTAGETAYFCGLVGEGRVRSPN
jgi:hypothetical protein